MYPWTRKSSLNFGGKIRIRSPDSDDILLGGRMRSPTAAVNIAALRTMMSVDDEVLPVSVSASQTEMLVCFITV